MTKLSFKTGLQTATWPTIVEMWDRAERIERLSGGWVNDHLYHPGYPERSETTFCYEAFTALGALAGRTTRLRLGTMVAANTFRHPAIVAKMAITLDHISDGRFDLGMGAGWHEAEHHDHGIELRDPATRVDQFAEALEVLDGLLRRPETSFEGRFYRLDGARSEPLPIQHPRVPITIGAAKPRMLALAARFADHWNMDGHDVGAFRERHARIVEEATRLGRDPAAIETSCQFWIGKDLVKARARAEALVAAGVGHLILAFYQPGPDIMESAVEALADL